jgi:tRNA pseudouridine55 synthase
MIHGLVVVHKEKGLSSHDVVAILKKVFHTPKTGHFGTLDPAANGLLLVALGHATKFFDFYVKKEKCYTGIIRFGLATTTYDGEGEPLGDPVAVDLNAMDIESLLAPFRGSIAQIPPPYSAKKFKGKPLYRYARLNQEVERHPARVEIRSLTGRVAAPDQLAFEAVTSAGTYIRSLAHDIGQKAGCGAHLQELTRQRIGRFSLDQALTVAEIRRRAETDIPLSVVIPFESLLPEFPKLIVTPEGRRGALNGMPLPPSAILKFMPAESNDYFRVFDDAGQFLAIYRRLPDSSTFRAHIVFPE